MTPSKLIAIRLNEKQEEELRRKQEAYELPTLSALVRLALQKLRVPRK